MKRQLNTQKRSFTIAIKKKNEREREREMYFINLLLLLFCWGFIEHLYIVQSSLIKKRSYLTVFVSIVLNNYDYFYLYIFEESGTYSQRTLSQRTFHQWTFSYYLQGGGAGILPIFKKIYYVYVSFDHKYSRK